MNKKTIPEHNLHIKLNPIQQDYFNAINWLIDERCVGEGRTHLLAVCFIKQAFQNPGKRIQVFDHFKPESIESSRRMMKLIAEILEHSPRIRNRFRIHQGSTPSLMYENETMSIKIENLVLQESRGLAAYTENPDET
jgi:hypothetical protein